MKKHSCLILLILWSLFLGFILTPLPESSFLAPTPIEITDELAPGSSLSASTLTLYKTHLDDTSLFTSQYHTGTYSETNCGPTSVYMVLKWLKMSPPPVDKLRTEITSNTGWVYTDEIESYLDEHAIDYSILSLKKGEDFLNALDHGILLLCLDISKIPSSTNIKPPTHLPPLVSKIPVGRESSSGTGHFVVATGYYTQDSLTYIEVLDPLNYQIRYYDLDALYKATSTWYAYLYLFTQ